MFAKAAEIIIDESLQLSIYQSNRTKLCVFIGSCLGPMVKGHFSFVTETSSNEGLPHALEHTIFTGSKSYPCNGMLDAIANLCLANGTNGFTRQTNTVYELMTVGSSGFLKALPVYLDHLLQPTLEKATFLTEIHHIDGKGKNSGVMYCEMAGRERDMFEMAQQVRKDLFYPEGSSYRANTGGRLCEIRNCSLEKVREFHAKFYHLNNMRITVCGQIDHKKLLETIELFESQNLSSVPNRFATPFQERVPRLDQPKSELILCPSDEESFGIVQMSWLGPEGSDIKATLALSMLFDYLTDSADAPMRKQFVQREDPFCTNIDFHILEQRDCEIVAHFEGVPIEKLTKIRNIYFGKTVAAHHSPKCFNMKRMGFILDHHIGELRSQLEGQSASLITDAVVFHQLFGQADTDYKLLKEYLNDAEMLRHLKKESADFWHALFTSYLANNNCVCVIAQPCKKMAEDYKIEEAKRIKQQTIDIGGEDGLKKCKQELDDAIHKNTCAKPTDEMMAGLIVSNLEDLNMIKVSTTTNWSTQQTDDFVSKFKFTTILHTISSNIFDAVIIIDTASIPSGDRQFLLLWFELMFQSPAKIAGNKVHFKEVARQAKKDLVSHSFDIGISGVHDHFIALRLRTKVENVSSLSKWARICLIDGLFDERRVIICARNLANKATDSRRDGDAVCHFLNATSAYTSETTTHSCSILGLEQFHRKVADAVANGRSKEVENRLEAVRRSVLGAPMNVHFSGDPGRFGDGTAYSISSVAIAMAKEWSFLEKAGSQPLLQCPADDGVNTAMYGHTRAVVVNGPDTAFLVQSTRFDDSWKGSSAVATLLLAQYLQQAEGPIWNAVRGNGLAYHVQVDVMPDKKALSLSLYRCSHLSTSYEQTRDTVRKLLSGRLSARLLDSAKRSLVSKLVHEQSTIQQTINSAILATIRSEDTNFTHNLCHELWNVNAEHVLAHGSPPLLRLFNESQLIRSIALNAALESELEHFPVMCNFQMTNAQEDSPGFELIKEGCTAVNIRFTEAVPNEGVTLIAYAEADGLILIDRNRSITSDLTV